MQCCVVCCRVLQCVSLDTVCIESAKPHHSRVCCRAVWYFAVLLQCVVVSSSVCTAIPRHLRVQEAKKEQASVDTCDGKTDDVM